MVGRLVVLIVAITLLLMACGSYDGTTEDGYPIWEGWVIVGIATPWGPIYFGGDEAPPEVTEHEWCHIRRAEELGWLKYYLLYFSDPVWACQEERWCGVDGPHPVCK